jgi:hypothetical protein
LIALYWFPFPAKTLAWFSGSSAAAAIDDGNGMFRGLGIVRDGAMHYKGRIPRR